MKIPLIRLWDHLGTAIIIRWKSGVRYTNQTMGTTCYHPEMEGVLYPLGNDIDLAAGELMGPQNELEKYFTGPPHCGSGAPGLTVADADVIDEILCRHSEFDRIKVDRDKLNESHEAWVYVTIQRPEEDYPLLSGFEFPISGILTWCNSD